MAVFQTAGAPPSKGRTIRANIGWSRNSSTAPVKMVTANRISMDAADQPALRLGMIFSSLKMPLGAERGVTCEYLRCHAPAGLVRWTEMELTEAEKLKAQ